MPQTPEKALAAQQRGSQEPSSCRRTSKKLCFSLDSGFIGLRRRIQLSCLRDYVASKAHLKSSGLVVMILATSSF